MQPIKASVPPLHYSVAGTGTVDVVLLHGFLESSSIWKYLIPLFDPSFRVILIDLPGHGNSPTEKGEHTIEEMGHRVYATLKEIGVNRFHLIGHSMGGYIALAIAETYASEIRTLTLLFSTYKADSPEKKIIREKSVEVMKSDFDRFVELGVPNLFGSYAKKAQEQRIQWAKEIALQTSTQGAITATKAMMQRPDRRDIALQLGSNLLVLLGKEDSAINSEVLLLELEPTEARTHLLSCGHNGHIELPEQCAKILNAELLV